MARSAQQDSHIQRLHQEEVWDLTHQTLSDHLRLELSGEVYEKADLIDVILHAASSAGTIENSSDSLAHIGGGHGIRYHLNPLALDDLERDLNAALAAHRPKRLLKRPRKVAIDVVLVPYYGTVDQADADFLIRSQAKVGTTRFFGYATLCLLHRHRRYTLALRCLRNSESCQPENGASRTFTKQGCGRNYLCGSLFINRFFALSCATVSPVTHNRFSIHAICYRRYPMPDCPVPPRPGRVSSPPGCHGSGSNCLLVMRKAC